MCNVCKTAKRYETPMAALRYIGSALKEGMPECVDALIGELVDQKLPKADKGADKDWELASRTGSDSRSERI